MVNRKYIEELKSYLLTDYHAQRIKEQKIDQSFYDGSYFIDNLKQDVRQVFRPSTASRMINNPASYIITSNPQAFRYPRKLGEEDKARKVAMYLNNTLQVVKLQNPNPMPQGVKTNLKRGETWLRLILNEKWTSENQEGMPVYYHVGEPLTVLGSPKEFNGIPEEVIVTYERSVRDIQVVWDKFKPKDTRTHGKVNWTEYWSAKERYFEADNEPVLDVQENVLGFVPFIHAYSGFGDESPDMRPDLLSVSAIRNVRDLLEEEASIMSDIRSAIHRHVFKSLLLKKIQDVETPKDLEEKIDLGPYSVNILPFGFDWIVPPDFMPPREAFEHLANIQRQIQQIMSPIFEGMMMGSSGRQTDILRSNAMQRYDFIPKAAEAMWTTAMSLTLRILDTIPDMLPIPISSLETNLDKEVTLLKTQKLTKDDIGGYYDCEVKFKAEDALERDRNATLYMTYYQQGLIDVETCLTEGFGKTQSQAKQIITKVLIDGATIRDPMFARMIGMEHAKETGMMEQFMQLLSAGQGIGQPITPTSPRQNEVQTSMGREMPDVNLQKRGIRERQTLGALG